MNQVKNQLKKSPSEHLGEKSADSSDADPGVAAEHVGAVPAAVDPGVIGGVPAVGPHVNVLRARTGPELPGTA